MSTENEIVLVGGSKDGLVTEMVYGLQSIQNIVLNDTKDGPEFVDRYVPANVEDKDGRTVYVHVGRYNAEESKSYWDRLDQSDIDALVAAAEAEEKAEAEAKAAEEAAAAEAEKENAEKPESEASDTEQVQNPETGEVTQEPVEETKDENSGD